MELQGYLKEIQWVFKSSFKNVLRKFLGCLKKVPKMFQEIFKKKFQGCFKNVSMKFGLQYQPSGEGGAR